MSLQPCIGIKYSETHIALFGNWKWTYFRIFCGSFSFSMFVFVVPHSWSWKVFSPFVNFHHISLAQSTLDVFGNLTFALIKSYQYDSIIQFNSTEKLIRINDWSAMFSATAIYIFVSRTLYKRKTKICNTGPSLLYLLYIYDVTKTLILIHPEILKSNYAILWTRS